MCQHSCSERLHNAQAALPARRFGPLLRHSQNTAKQQSIVHVLSWLRVHPVLRSAPSIRFWGLCFVRNPATKQSQAAGCPFTCFALCLANGRASHCVLMPRRSFHCPARALLPAFCVNAPKKKKRAMITTRPGWCEKGAHQDPKTLQLHTVCPSSKSTNCVFSGKRNIMRICKLSDCSR